MFANFLNLAFNSAPSEITSSFAGLVEATGFELEPLDSWTGAALTPLKDSASVEYTNLISLRFLVLSKVSTTFNFCSLLKPNARNSLFENNSLKVIDTLEIEY